MNYRLFKIRFSMNIKIGHVSLVSISLQKFILLLSLFFGTTQAEKNVLLIMADDLNDWVGVLGGNPQVLTPNIDKFAKKSVIFRNAHCASPVCHPSRTAMLTGLRPTTTKIFSNQDPFFRTNPAFKNLITLPQFFKNKGYVTAKAGKIFHLGDGIPEDMVSWNESSASGEPAAPTNKIPTGMKAGSPTLEWGISADATAEVTGEWKASNSIADYLRKGTSKQLFLAYGTHKPHLPWFVPKKFFELYDKTKLIMPEVLAGDLSDVPKPTASNNLHAEILRTNNWANAVQGYLASVSYADYCIGNVLDALEASTYKDSTIVMIMGDHGWHLGEKNHWGKVTNWEEGTRTTLIMYDPTIAKAGIVDQAVSLQDIYPTIMELTGNAIANQLEGRSFVPILKNPQQNNFIGWALVSYSQGTAHTLRTDKWAMIRYDDGPGKYLYELYNMFEDPLQHTNLANKPENASMITKFSTDIDHIIKKEAPVNLDIYGKAPSVNVRKLSEGGKHPAILLNSKIYRLQAYSENGRLVREFQGRGADIERMIALRGELGLPPGHYIYRVFDRENRLVETVNAFTPAR